MTTQASTVKPLQRDAVGVALVLLSDETCSALQWAGFFVVLTALFLLEKLSQVSA